MVDRAEILAPLYACEGRITVELDADSDIYRRGDCAVVTSTAADRYLFDTASCLVRWERWLRKARVGTLRWLAAQETQLAAGTLRATASVRSQLFTAGLVERSDMWGDRTTEDCYNLRVWARVELDRRDS